MQYFFPNKTVKEKNLFYQVSSKNFKIIYLQVWLDLPMDTNSVAYLQLNLSSKESCTLENNTQFSLACGN